jgi:hypothetical protein
VLSTPPAFVLSQDQTLHECSKHPPERNQERNKPHGSLHPNWICYISKKPSSTPPTNRQPAGSDVRRGINILALTFSTLLSSQGTDTSFGFPSGSPPGASLRCFQPYQTLTGRFTDPIRTRGRLESLPLSAIRLSASPFRRFPTLSEPSPRPLPTRTAIPTLRRDGEPPPQTPQKKTFRHALPGGTATLVDNPQRLKTEPPEPIPEKPKETLTGIEPVEVEAARSGRGATSRTRQLRGNPKNTTRRPGGHQTLVAKDAR